jgi:hypothetical protein
MNSEKYIGLDVHQATISVAVLVMSVIDFTPAMHAKAVVRTASGFTRCLTLELSNAE